jgi:segregation and condensation protein B
MALYSALDGVKAGSTVLFTTRILLSKVMAKRRSDKSAGSGGAGAQSADPQTAEMADALRHPPDDRGLSLESLTSAFAEVLNRGQDPYEADEASAGAGPAGSEEVIVRPVDLPVGLPVNLPVDGPDISPRSIVEAMLFVGNPQNEPLTSQQIAGLMRGVRAAEIDDLVQELNEQYRERGCPYTIRSEGAGYRLVVSDEHAGLRERLAGRTREARLSQAAIEVLALVAYNGSISSEQISAIRGRSSGGILTQLVRRRLLRIERNAENRRQTHYSTTERFLQLFGLESLADLPRGQEVEQR